MCCSACIIAGEQSILGSVLGVFAFRLAESGLNRFPHFRIQNRRVLAGVDCAAVFDLARIYRMREQPSRQRLFRDLTGFSHTGECFFLTFPLIELTGRVFPSATCGSPVPPDEPVSGDAGSR